MSLAAFQRRALHNAVRSTLVDRLQLLGLGDSKVTEGLWTLHKGGSLGATGLHAIEADKAIENLVQIIERNIAMSGDGTEQERQAEQRASSFSKEDRDNIQKAADFVKQAYQALEQVEDGVDDDIDSAFTKIDEAGDLLDGFLGGDEAGEGDTPA